MFFNPLAWFKRPTVEQTIAEQLYEARIQLLNTQAVREQAEHTEAMLAARVKRLSSALQEKGANVVVMNFPDIHPEPRTRYG